MLKRGTGVKLNRPYFLGLIFFFAFVFFAFVGSSALAVDQKTQDLYQSTCQGCHGPGGKASAIGRKLGAKDFQDAYVAKMSKSDLEKIAKNGKNKMPAYQGKLTEQQIHNLVKYIKEMK